MKENLDASSMRKTTIAQREQPGYYPGFHTLSQQAYWDKATRDLILQRVAAPPPVRFFTPDEAETMQAVVDRMIPQEDRTPERRIPILGHIDERLYANRLEGYRFEDMPPDQEAYRIAIKAIDAMAEEFYQSPFARLCVRDQEQILQSIHDGEPLAAAGAWKSLNIKRFWSMLVSDCATPYYSHPWAWDEIGFGGPAYPRGYMRLEHGEPEPWEQREQRYEWEPPADTISGRPQKAGK